MVKDYEQKTGINNYHFNPNIANYSNRIFNV